MLQSQTVKKNASHLTYFFQPNPSKLSLIIHTYVNLTPEWQIFDLCRVIFDLRHLDFGIVTDDIFERIT